MALIIQKFGGTSLADTAKIKQLVNIIQNEITNGNKVVVVVSAMAGATNDLIELCKKVSKLSSNANLAEYDVALSSGEMVSASLLSLCLQEIGVNARSILAWQLPIITDLSYSKALVKVVDNSLILECLNNNIIPVIAGFQGVNTENRITTLSRGGSDITATLIAASIKADRCDIYTDVEGVFSADPKIIDYARKIAHIGFEEMLELSSSGAKVVHERSVAIAMKYNIPTRVLSSFNTSSGTLITCRENIIEETNKTTSITSNKDLFQLKIQGLKINFLEICNTLLRKNIGVNFIINEGCTFNCVVNSLDKSKLEMFLNDLQAKSLITDFSVNNNISIISVVGYGINNNILISNVVEILSVQRIEIKMFQLSETRISMLINDHDSKKAINLLHSFFETNEKV